MIIFPSVFRRSAPFFIFDIPLIFFPFVISHKSLWMYHNTSPYQYIWHFAINFLSTNWFLEDDVLPCIHLFACTKCSFRSICCQVPFLHPSLPSAPSVIQPIIIKINQEHVALNRIPVMVPYMRPLFSKLHPNINNTKSVSAHKEFEAALKRSPLALQNAPPSD